MDREIVRELEEALLSETSLRLYHISTTSLDTESLFAVPLGQEEDRTTCKKHLLLATSPSDHAEESGSANKFGAGAEVFFYGLEIYAYYTKTSATIFVSKADSSGHLRASTKRAPGSSAVQKITQVFIRRLLDDAEGQQLKTTVSLFARAQDQYLFPASKENPGKHILDDRQLIRWWCQAIDPLLAHGRSKDGSASAHILVPGLEDLEVRQLLPRSSRYPSQTDSIAWEVGYPLSRLASITDLAPRCLIPRFPDDPKARFMDALDVELFGRETDDWREVRTVADFWDRMQFRQECCAGRMVGFIWVIVDYSHHASGQVPGPLNQDLPKPPPCHQLLLDPEGGAESGVPRSQDPISTSVPKDLSTGTVIADIGTVANRDGPQDQTHAASETVAPRTSLSSIEVMKNQIQDERSRGRVEITEEQYDHLFEALTNLDFGTSDNALKSTTSWICTAAESQGWDPALDWGQSVKGQCIIDAVSATRSVEKPFIQTTVLLGRKRKRQNGADSRGSAATVPLRTEPVSVHGPDKISKKPKN